MEKRWKDRNVIILNIITYKETHLDWFQANLNLPLEFTVSQLLTYRNALLIQKLWTNVGVNSWRPNVHPGDHSFMANE